RRRRPATRRWRPARPDIGEGQRGRVVDPVPHHDGGRAAALEADGVEFLGGRALGGDLLHARHPPARPGRLSAAARRAWRRAVLAQGGAPVTPAQAAFPTVTRRPPTTPRMPWPGISST